MGCGVEEAVVGDVLGKGTVFGGVRPFFFLFADFFDFFDFFHIF